MKKIMDKVSYVLIVLIGIFVSLTLTSCGADESFSDNRIAPPAPKDTTKVTPTPDPEEPDTTQWKTVGEKTLRVDENRLVTSTIFGLKHDGIVDSLVLKYMLKFQLSAPDTVRLTQPGTELTKYAGSITSPSAHYEHKWEGKDSLCVVTTTKGYKTTFFNVVWETSHTLGWTLIKGMFEPYKYDVESSQAIFDGNSLQRYCEPYEVERNDSIYLREELRNVVQMTFHGRTFVEEKKVVVDHFLRVKEKAEEPKDETAEFDIPDYIGVQAYVRSYDVIKKRWNDAILIDSKEAYYIVTIPFTYNKEKDKEQVITSNGKVEKHITKWSKSEVGETKEYNSVLNYQGTFYPAAMTVDAYGWYCVFNKTIDQSIDMNQATISGLKNQPKNGNAKGDPRVEHVVSKSASGQVVTITGKTIGHTISTTLKIK